MDGITRTLIGFFHFVHPVPILLTTLNLCSQGVIGIRHAALCPVPEDFADRQEERPQAEGDPNQLTERQGEQRMAQLVLGLRVGGSHCHQRQQAQARQNQQRHQALQQFLHECSPRFF